MVNDGQSDAYLAGFKAFAPDVVQHCPHDDFGEREDWLRGWWDAHRHGGKDGEH
jgi:ribosome modulation factor